MTDIAINLENKMFSVSQRGMANVWYVLDEEVREWLDGSGSNWELVGGTLPGWTHRPGLTLAYSYFDPHTQTAFPAPLAVFSIENPTIALLFKLTWV